MKNSEKNRKTKVTVILTRGKRKLKVVEKELISGCQSSSR